MLYRMLLIPTCFGPYSDHHCTFIRILIILLSVSLLRYPDDGSVPTIDPSKAGHCCFLSPKIFVPFTYHFRNLCTDSVSSFLNFLT